MRSLLLDVFRIILCLLVVDQHLFYVFQAGGVAVVGFFVLSGYFLAKHFEKCETEFNYSAFYIKKAENLLPEYILGAALGAGCLFMGEPFVHPNFATCPFTLTALAEALNYPCWFISCLLLFFALAPLFYSLYRTAWGIHPAFLSALIYSVGLYTVVDDSKMLYYSSQCNLVFFLAGISARQMRKTNFPNVRGKKILIVGSSLLLMTFVLIPEPSLLIRYTSCMLCMILIPLLDTPQAISARWQQLTIWASSLTYGIFLLHVPVFHLYGKVISKYSEVPLYPTAQLTAFLFTVLVAALIVPSKKKLLSLMHRRLGK